MIFSFSNLFLDLEYTEPTAITHEKKGKWSSKNPYDYGTHV